MSKGRLTQKKGKQFTKLTKEIIVSARMGGGSPDGNAPTSPCDSSGEISKHAQGQH